jgi:hypothetical protein
MPAWGLPVMAEPVFHKPEGSEAPRRLKGNAEVPGPQVELEPPPGIKPVIESTITRTPVDENALICTTPAEHTESQFTPRSLREPSPKPAPAATNFTMELGRAPLLKTPSSEEPRIAADPIKPAAAPSMPIAGTAQKAVGKTEDPEKARHKVNFDNLTPLYPDERLKMEFDDPTKKDQRQSQPEALPSLAGFASFAKRAMASAQSMPTAKPSLEPEIPFPVDRPPVVEKVKSEAAQHNTVHIGRVDIQITPPPEQPKPAPRPAQTAHATILARGFTSWFGLRQG